MRPVFQSAPDQDAPHRQGDCFRACIASLLEMQRSEVPHFYAGLPGGAQVPPDTEASMQSWFAQKGLALLHVPFIAPDAETVMSAVSARHPGLHYILCGKSYKGRDHAVIVRDGVIVHDPSRVSLGLHAPQDDGCFHAFMIGLLV